MPAIYAHDSFGKQVLEALPEELKQLIHKYEDLYTIGLQGPDILFYNKPLSKNPINRLGSSLHREKASNFLNNARQIIQEKEIDSKECVYILGFICHYMLDSKCHPYVDKQIKQTTIGHIEIESEFEKYLMKKDGLDPISHRIGEFVIVSEDVSSHIAPFYNVSDKDIYESLKDMRFIKNILVAKHLPKRLFLRAVMKLSGQYESLQGHLYKLRNNPKLVTSNHTLETMLKEEVIPTRDMIIDFYSKINSNEELNERFNRDFE